MGTPSPENVSTKQQRIAMLAKQMPGVPLNSLSHHIDIDWMKEALRRTRKDGATGVDGGVGVEPVMVADEDSGDIGDRAESSGGLHRIGLPIRPSTRYSCSTVSHW